MGTKGLRVLLSAAILISMAAVVLSSSSSVSVIATYVVTSTSSTTTSSTTTSSTTTSSTLSTSTTTSTSTTIPFCLVDHGPWGWFSNHFGRFLPPQYQNNCIPTTSTSTSTVTTTILPVNTGLGTPIVSPPSPAPGSGFTISCPANSQNFNCINAYANGLQKECKWIKWVGNNAIFECKGMPAGTYTAECAAIPDTNNHCSAASTTLSYSVIAPSTSTSTSTVTTTILPVDTGLGNPTVSPTSPASGSGFTIACPAKNQNFNCINAYANGLQKECKWIKWVGNNAIFDCHGLSAGTYTAECVAIPDTDNHCSSASTTLSYSVIASSTITTTTRSTTVPTTKSTTVRTTTINPCHYWDGQDYDGCSPLTTTESTTIPTTSTKSTTILPTTTVTTCTTCPTGTKASGNYCIPQCKRGVPCPQYILLCPSAFS